MKTLKLLNYAFDQWAPGEGDLAEIRSAIDRLSQATQHLAELIMNSAIEKALKDKRVREVQ